MEKMESKIEEFYKNLFTAQERTIRMMAEEGTTEAEIMARVTELRNYVIDSDSMNNSFKNDKLNKIWKGKRKF